MRSLLAALIITIIGTQVQAATLEEFNSEMSKFRQETQARLDKLGEMLNTLDQKDLDKLNASKVDKEGNTQADYVVTGAAFLYSGLDTFQSYLDSSK